MKRFYTISKKILTDTCIIFTILSLLISILGALALEKSVLKSSTVFLFLLTSVLVSISNTIFSIEKLNIFFRMLLHMCACVFSYLASMYITRFFGATFYSAFSKPILVIAFCALYMIIAFPVWAVYSSIKRKNSIEKEYTPMFNGNKQERP